jgi:outer membrane protein insertion porin family
VEVLTDKNLRLSPVLVAMLATSMLLSLAKTARSEGVDSSVIVIPVTEETQAVELSSVSSDLSSEQARVNSVSVLEDTSVEGVDQSDLMVESPSSLSVVKSSQEIAVEAVETSPTNSVVIPVIAVEANSISQKPNSEEMEDSGPVILPNNGEDIEDSGPVILPNNQGNPQESTPTVIPNSTGDREESVPTVIPNSTGDGTSTTGETTPTQPEPRVLVAEVVISGADADRETLVYKTISTKAGRTTTRSRLQEDVNAIYATGLFANVTVIPEDTPLGVRVTFSVEQNPILREVVIQTVPEDEEKQVVSNKIVEDIFSSGYGEILDLRQLQEDIKELDKWYRDNGYDLAQVVGAPEVAADGTVTLVVAEGIIENIQVRYFDSESKSVEGRTREFIVTREVELKPGDVFNRNTAQKDLQRVFGLGLFEDAKLSFSPGEDPSKVVVNVDVVESNTGSIAAGAGISSASGLFGSVSYQQKNLGGNNQTLAAELQLGTREFLFDTSFTDPWIGGDPYRTSYTVNAFRRRSISLIFDGGDDVDLANGDTPRIVRTGGGVNFSRPIPANPFGRSDWRLSTGLQYQRVRITDSDGETSPQDEFGNDLAFSDSGKDDLITLQFGAARDLRDNPLQPTSGSLLRFGVDQSLPFGSGSILMNRLRASYSYYIPVKYINFGFSEGPQALAFNVQAGTVIGDLPPYEAFSLGGSNSVRGYDEGDLGSGRSYIQATAEYRFPIFSVVGGALFFDFGTDLGTGNSVPGDPAGIRDKPGTGFGYGVGVRIKSPLGPIRVDYGLNDQGDSRFHFGIGERF